MPTTQTHPVEREHAEAEKRRPAAPTPAIKLAPSALTRALQRRIPELSERPHAMTTKRSIKATVALRRISM
jgi:hypothetical protein